MKRALIIGAGPAGLTAAYELLEKSDQMEVVVLEESSSYGGIARTVEYKGNRMDMGGHRFFSKIPEVNDWWEKMLPMQGKPAYDDRLLDRPVQLAAGGPDPEKNNRVMLLRHRVSRILFDKNFYDYPISLRAATFKNMGLIRTAQAGFSYLYALIHRLPEDNLENFYINRFGRRLYSMFFEHYTQNLWGRHPREIDASWGRQRVKGLSIKTVIMDVAGRAAGKKRRRVETSLIEEFKYPKFGPGQLWDVTASKVEAMGGTIIKNAKVVRLHKNADHRISLLVYEKDGKEFSIEGDYVISSMPVKDLVAGMNDVPGNVARIAAGLPYRDYMTLGVLVRRLNLKNQTKLRTVGGIVPDCWIYVQDQKVKMGRMQIYNNWSPYMVKDLKHTVWVGLEYFVDEGDRIWSMNEKEFSRFAVSEMVQLGFIDSPQEVIDTHMEKVKKAYPAYFDTYAQMETLKEYLKTIENLYCVGRNGQHRYNNIDHSMAASFGAVKNILSGNREAVDIWSINTEQVYHEQNIKNAAGQAAGRRRLRQQKNQEKGQ